MRPDAECAFLRQERIRPRHRFYSHVEKRQYPAFRHIPCVRLANWSYLSVAIYPSAMRLIGLTGNIASGKSAVSEMLAERGATIVDADVLAREAVTKGSPA